MKSLLSAALNLLRHSLVSQFEICRNGRRVTYLPFVVVVLLIIIRFWVAIPILFFAFLGGCRYRLAGPPLIQEEADQVLSQASRTVESAAQRVREEIRKAEKAKRP